MGASSRDSDGTVDGTNPVKDIWDGSANSLPRLLATVAGTLYFDARTARWLCAVEVGWHERRDGRRAEHPRAGGMRRLGSADGGWAYYAAEGGAKGREPWRSQGTDPTTCRIDDVWSGGDASDSDSFVSAGGVLYFVATEPDPWTRAPSVP